MSQAVTVVTGASSGIGLALCTELMRAGATVLGTYRGSHTSEGLAYLRSVGVDVHAMDVTNPLEIGGLARYVADSDYTILTLINNAGTNAKALGVTGSGRQLLNVPPEKLLAQYSVNAIGPVLVTRALLGHMVSDGTATVVNVGSRSGLLQHSGASPDPGYAASKAALHAFSASLAAELASARIRVLAVDPGWTRTRIGGPHAGRDARETARRLLRNIHKNADAAAGGFMSDSGALTPW